jgi:pimeloyl-ACP methyl ester carboxylesterase
MHLPVAWRVDAAPASSQVSSIEFEWGRPSMLDLPTSAEWARRCGADGEFMLAARHWTGGLKLSIGSKRLGITLRDGAVSAGVPRGSAGLVQLSAERTVWEQMLQPTPPRFLNDVFAALMTNGISRRGDPVTCAQYHAATARAVELLRTGIPRFDPMADESGDVPRHDTPVGRYVHIELDGHDHRIYYEAAGQGIPLLLQHTAGCHGSQWRHLFEDLSITRNFRLIAYDLPYHGKSLPPPSKDWWSQRYELRGDFLRSVPLALSRALALERPVFMGCSVGGLLALDLAHRYPDAFRAVIAVEGALAIGGDPEQLTELWHPQVSNEYKARAMEALIAPTSPLPYRKETSFVYASGWPQAFLGDLYYYIQEYDLRDVAGQIDTRRIGVHIMSGEYDFSGTVELGREAHAAIAGSTFTEMEGVGHFPMTENPVAFIRYLTPVLERIRSVDA